jgi:uncharacterized protein involved in type VI secretion and phage assembly
MPVKTLEIQYPTIKSDGTALTQAIDDKLLELTVESTYQRPDLCLLTFLLEANEDIPPQFGIGKKIEVSFKADTTSVTVFKGEVTAIDYEARYERTCYVVECQDQFHRFFRDDKTRTFLKQKVSDVAGAMATEHGISSLSTATSTVYEYLMQQNMSNGQWLVEQAAKRNYQARVSEGRLLFTKVGSGGDSSITLEVGNQLISFNARVTGGAFLKEASVIGWDVTKKEAIVGKATSATARQDDKVKQAPWNAAGNVSLIRTGDVPAKGEADTIATAVMERRNEHGLQAEGLCWGQPRLMVDKLVSIRGANTRFNGKYRVSRLVHRYSHDEGFMTEFSCRGATDQSVSAVIQEAAGERAGFDRSIFDGAAIAIVTDNKDPDELGRVKVKFPTLPLHQGQDAGSDWMRMVFPGAGGADHHGWYLLPEVNDEVLVLFEQGDVRRGYVLGGLHNGKDKPKLPNSQALQDGKVNQHAFRLRTGGHLLFDEKGGEEKIELKNKDGKFLFTFFEKEGVKILDTHDGKKIVIDGMGNIEITSQKGDITIDAKSGGINLKAMKDITLDAKGKVAIKATQDATVDGMNVKITGQTAAEVKGNATAKLEASGQTVVKGGMVMIN